VKLGKPVTVHRVKTYADVGLPAAVLADNDTVPISVWRGGGMLSILSDILVSAVPNHWRRQPRGTGAPSTSSYFRAA